MIDAHDRDRVRVLELAHGKANTLDLELLGAIGARLAEAEADGVAGLVLTGRGSIFSAGVDLFRLLEEDDAYLDRFLPELDRLLERLLLFPAPVVAAVNGHAIAGGLIVALACDRRLMATGNGRLGVPELLVGVPFPALPLEVVRAAAAPPLFHEMVLTGRTYGAEEAHRHRLVDALAAPEALLDEALRAARAAAAIPAASYALAKRQLREPLLHRARRLAERWDAEVRQLWGSEEIRGAIRAYVESLAK